MGLIRRYWELIKLLFRYIQFKFRQNRLKTSERHIVTTTYGPIKGVKRISIWNDPFWSFEKIPFAKPPLGELRFKAPEPPDPWHMVLDCTREGPVPLQTNIVSRRIEGSEDCLYLNVYTKNLNPFELMPVMVWIYGGGFENGGATKDLYSPDYFMQKDVVLVTISYRVGPFGFLSLRDPDLKVPGNAGLKDQVLALEWVKMNCILFGGNPENITLFGESAGAASTHYMMLSQRTKDLFHKVILMSGCALCPWAILPEMNIGLRLAKALGYNGPDNITEKECFEIIRNAKGTDLLGAEKKILTKEEKMKRMLFPFGPTIEPYITDDTIITEEPRMMMRKAWSRKIPMIIGGTSDEGLILTPEVKKAPQFINGLGNCENLVPTELQAILSGSDCSKLGLLLKKEYFNNEAPSMQKVHSYLDLMSYKYFWHPIQRTIDSRLKYAPGAPTYLYRFDIDSTILNVVRKMICGKDIRGACHADDLCYIFLTVMTPQISAESKEYFAIQRFLGAWVNFATNGNPNSSDDAIIWKPINDNDKPYKCMNFGLDYNEIITLPESRKLELWDSFYPKHLLY